MASLGVWVTTPRLPGSPPVPLRQRLAPLRERSVLRLVTVTFLAASGGLMFYTYLGSYAAHVTGTSQGLLPLLLLLVGLSGLVGAVSWGRAADVWGPQRSLRGVLAGHALALAGATALLFNGLGNRYVLAAAVVCWAFFAWGLAPPVQGSVLAATGPTSGMTALSLNIAGLYLGTGAAGAVGGTVIGALGASYVPPAAAVLMTLALLLAPGPRPCRATAKSGGPTSPAPAAPSGGHLACETSPGSEPLCQASPKVRR